MNITFLIGNGFDVGLGMKSRFKDFFPIYVEKYKEKYGELNGLAKSIEQEEDAWSYFERQLGKYTQEFTAESKNDFKNQLKEFELDFMEYLKSVENGLDFSNKKKLLSTMLDGINKFYSDDNLPTVSSNRINAIFNKCNGENHTVNFICFNYTYCLENCLDVIPNKTLLQRNHQGYAMFNKIGKIVHIHGYRDKNPIMGLNDESQINNQELAKDKRFAKWIVKPIINEVIRMNYDAEASSLIDQSIIICIYGMSLGETDKKWWQKILNWLSADANRQLVIFDYDEDFNASSQFDMLDKEDDIIERLESFSPKKDFDIEALRNRIHIAPHKNIFKMDLTGKKDAVAASAEVAESEQKV